MQDDTGDRCALYLTTLHRVPATPAFALAADFILQRAKEYGLSDAHIEHFPIDGAKAYGLRRSYLSWNVEKARLWKVGPGHLLIGDWATDPIRLADYSHSADVETELIDVGNGVNEADYQDKDVRGQIVLADGVLARVQQIAVIERGAAEIVSTRCQFQTAVTFVRRDLQNTRCRPKISPLPERELLNSDAGQFGQRTGRGARKNNANDSMHTLESAAPPNWLCENG